MRQLLLLNGILTFGNTMSDLHGRNKGLFLNEDAVKTHDFMTLDQNNHNNL